MDRYRNNISNPGSPDHEETGMKVQRLLVPGRFQDAYLYRDWLIGLTDYRSLKFVHLATFPDQVLRFFKASVSGGNDVTLGKTEGESTAEGAASQLGTELIHVSPEPTREVDL